MQSYHQTCLFYYFLFFILSIFIPLLLLILPPLSLLFFFPFSFSSALSFSSFYSFPSFPTHLSGLPPQLPIILHPKQTKSTSHFRTDTSLARAAIFCWTFRGGSLLRDGEKRWRKTTTRRRRTSESGFSLRKRETAAPTGGLRQRKIAERTKNFGNRQRQDDE